jgi:Fe-S-cluster-containing dehydrogenase component/CRP-like cAMP-binding protein|nr:cyclic nucleotide-binding domain-containing protein [Kofleriaceae bacterium]
MSVASAVGGAQVTGASYLEFLSQLAFLKPISHEDLAAFANTVLVRQFTAGQDIVVQRQYGHAMFVLVSGAVGVSVIGNDDKSVKLGVLQNVGDYFGEAALLGRGERTATVTAENNVTLLEFEKHRFDLICRRYPKVREALETVYHARAIATYMRTHNYLGKLDDKTRQTLGNGAKLRMFQRGDDILKAGDKVTDVLLIKDGVAKATRAKGTATSILAYFNTHDVVGVADMNIRNYTLTALGQCEVITLQHGVFSMAMINHPDIAKHFTKDDMNRQGVLEGIGTSKQTVFGALDKLLGAGVEVESLLIINLDRCVRCGNCVRACHSRHEYTRLDRRGPIFKRRAEIGKQGVHEHVMMPASCRHCRDPECMIGCPTGAIQRSPSGDVDINNNCIGCENCARKCPYGNITMRPLDENDPTKPNKEVTKRAIKCNLCRDYSYSNCVHECPRGAILRVDPLRYFEELALVMEAEQREAIEYQRKLPGSKQQVKPRSTWFIPASFVVGLILIAAVVGAALFATPGGMSAMQGGSMVGIPLGLFAAFCLFSAAFLGARKRMRNSEKAGVTNNDVTPPKITKPKAALFPRGNLESWTQFHMMFGLVGFVTAAAHAGFHVTGIFTTLLMIVFSLEVITGALGQLIYMTVPKTLTRLERHGLARLVEDLVDEEQTLDTTIAELVQTVPAKTWGEVRGKIDSVAGSIGSRTGAKYDPPAALEAAKKSFQAPGEVTEDVRGTLDRVLESKMRLLDVRAQLRLHRSLRRWLIWHVATATALVVLVVFHIVTALTVI